MVLKQLIVILSALFLGYTLSSALHLPIPANVLGLVLLFAGLCIGIVKLRDVEQVSDFIIKYLAIFFVTPTIGIMQYFDLIGKQFLQIAVPLMLSILIGFFVAAKVTEFCINIGDKKKKKGLGADHGE